MVDWRAFRFACVALIGCAEPVSTRIDAVSPAVLCDEGDAVKVEIRGQGLTVGVRGALTGEPSLVPPSVTLRPAAGLAAGSAPATEREIAVPAERVRWKNDDVLTVEVDAGLGLETGTWDVVVRGSDGSDVVAPLALAVIGPPVIRAFDPPGVCHERDPAQVGIVGDGLVVLDGQWPVADIGGTQSVATSGVDCQPLAVAGVDGQVCGAVIVDVHGPTYPLGAVPVTVTNPAPAACTSTQPATVEIQPPPEAYSVEPDALCAAGTSRMTVLGDAFTPGTWVEVGGVPALDVEFVDSGTLRVQLDPATPVGSQDVVVVSDNQCTAEIVDAIKVVAAPLVFYVDPPVIYSGVAVEATVYVADVVGAITGVELVDPASGTVTALDWRWDPAVPGIVHASIPAGLADGAWDLRVLQDDSCGGIMTGGVVIDSVLSIPIDEVDPPFAWTFDFTPVDIRAVDPIPAGMVGFQDTPRVVLIGPDGAGETIPVLGVSWKSDTLLNAVIPLLLDPGSYDVLITNPDGTLGLLEDAVQVTLDAPPRIFDVGPVTLENSSDQRIEIQGRDFRNPTVELDCLDLTLTTVPATIESWSYATIAAWVPTTQFNTAICVVRVINDDGTTAEWSSLSITNPAQNLFPWKIGTNMVEARRAPAGASGRTTSVQRFVYAIGGDAGDPSTAKTSVEVAPVDVFGNMGDWTLLPRGLPAPRTLAQAVVIGRFVYLVGGNDGTQPVDTVLRAKILDPLDVPFFQSLSVLPGAAGLGLGGGTWRYRVSAVYDPLDPANPGGESLPSDSIAIVLPDVPDKLQPELIWTPLAGAVGYRVYRTANPDQAAGTETLLAEVATSSYVDDGSVVPNNEEPLPAGALGEWAYMPAMSVPREAPCVATAPDPFPDPEKIYLYAAGGQDTASVHDTIEYLQIVLVSDDEQVPWTWVPSVNRLAEPRHQCGGYGVDHTLHSVVDRGEAWIYFVAGIDDRGSTSNVVDSGRVLEGGDLELWQTISQLTPGRAGFAKLSASNFLYAFGGQNAGPSQNGASGELVAVDLPDVQNWNSLGTAMGEKRYLPGSAQESAVVFVLGGATDLAPATNTTDWTNF